MRFPIRRLSLLPGLLYCLLTPGVLLAQRCGKERWSVKTGTDADAGRVGLTSPQDSTIAELIALTPPHPIPPTTRTSPTETTVFTVNATLTDYKLEGGPHGDSDYHLVLQDAQGNTMVAEIPSPNCVADTSPFAAQIAGARAKFDSQFTATTSFQTADIPVQVTGVGFFDFPHGQHGAAQNVIELHPVLDIIFNPQQSGGADFSVVVVTPTIHVAQGGSSSTTITTSSLHGQVSNVALNVSGLPTNINTHITPTGGGNFTLTVTASASAPTGSFPITVSGTAGGKSHSQVVTLNVTAPASTATGQEWEYQLISANSENEILDQANKLGAQDWELVSVVKVQGTPGWKAFFKRVKRDY